MGRAVARHAARLGAAWTLPPNIFMQVDGAGTDGKMGTLIIGTSVSQTAVFQGLLFLLCWGMINMERVAAIHSSNQGTFRNLFLYMKLCYCCMGKGLSTNHGRSRRTMHSRRHTWRQKEKKVVRSRKTLAIVAPQGGREPDLPERQSSALTTRPPDKTL